jgi:ADP-ribosylglycohydrolase
MYIAPVGVVNACNPQAAYNEAIAFASGHQQSYGLEAAGVLAGAVAAAFVPGTNITQIVKIAYELAKDGTRRAISEIAEVAEALRNDGAEQAQVVAMFQKKIARFSPMGDDLNHTANRTGVASPNYQPSRFLSIEELPFALGFAIVAGGDFKASILDGINSGRDTDSIGVMAGAILGAMHGESVVDIVDAEQLDSANKLDLAAEAHKFAQTAAGIIDTDETRAADILQQRAGLAIAGATKKSTIIS